MEHSDDAERGKVVTGPRKRRSAKSPVLGGPSSCRQEIPHAVRCDARQAQPSQVDRRSPARGAMARNAEQRSRPSPWHSARGCAGDGADRAMAPHTQVFAIASAYSSIPSERWRGSSASCQSRGSRPKRLFTTAAQYVNDTKVKDRLDAVRNTYARAEDAPTTGAKKLAELMGEHGKEFVGHAAQNLWRRESGPAHLALTR